MMKRQTLQLLKKQARAEDYRPDRPTTHALIDHGLEALDVIDGGKTVTDRNKEIRAGLAELRQEVQKLANTAQDSLHPEYGERTLYMLDLVAGMLTTDYRRYSSWADVRQQIDEEFS